MAIDVEFQAALRSLINQHNVDNECNIPDYALAGLVCENLSGIAAATRVMEHHGWVNPNSEKTTEKQG